MKKKEKRSEKVKERPQVLKEEKNGERGEEELEFIEEVR